MLDERLGSLNCIDSRYALVLLTVVACVCVSVVIDNLYLLSDRDKFLPQEFLAHFTQGLAAVGTSGNSFARSREGR